jgi:hypothetical protein
LFTLIIPASSFAASIKTINVNVFNQVMAYGPKNSGNRLIDDAHAATLTLTLDSDERYYGEVIVTDTSDPNANLRIEMTMYGDKDKNKICSKDGSLLLYTAKVDQWVSDQSKRPIGFMDGATVFCENSPFKIQLYGDYTHHRLEYSVTSDIGNFL